jgi:hypothetical protein
MIIKVRNINFIVGKRLKQVYDGSTKFLWIFSTNNPWNYPRLSVEISNDK